MPIITKKSTGIDTGATRWLLTGLTIVAMLATASLAIWQLQRASAKELLAAQIVEKKQLPALESISPQMVVNAADAGKESLLLHRNVRLRGRWLSEHTVFLDNRYMAGRPGFFVVTPLLQETTGSVVWVQRGWVARDPIDRTRLPSLALAQGPVTVTGRVIQEVSRVYSLEAPSETQTFAHMPADLDKVAVSALGTARASHIWQNLPRLSFGSQIELLSLAILETAEPELTQKQVVLLRDWPQADVGVAKHYGYAFQWFALCILILVLYVWFQIVAPRRRKS